VVDEERVPPSADIAGEDFLFHLYRGSELLQDNRVHEAKQELEHALGLQPRDPKGQDLLAIVYFRLGLYPRAIAIYEELIATYGEATTPRINLALCYLKTGQPSAARAELEKVIEKDPSHARAWGYLGLAFQRLGDLDRAIHAFQTGGHHQMARRLVEVASPNAGRALSGADREAVSRAATLAFEELDKRELASLRPDASGDRSTPAGTWAAVEPGRESYTSLERRSLPGVVLPSDSLVPPATRGAPSITPAIAPPPDLGEEPSFAAPPRALDDLAREHLLVFGRTGAPTAHASGAVLFPASRGESGAGIAARMDVVRAITQTGGLGASALPRRVRGRDTEEPLGGTTSPLMRLGGIGGIVLVPAPGTKLVPIELGAEPLFIRESALVAMDGDVIYENGRLPLGDGDSAPIVQLRGPGAVAVALPLDFVAIEAVRGESILARGHSLLGWTGQVVPRALSASEAPGRTRGFVSLSGDGTVLLDGR
jgi:hypothetical protein